jgi:GNAT superfamily N-acetyltransferase
MNETWTTTSQWPGKAMSSRITYSVERTIAVEQFRDLLVASTLGERRPVDEPKRLEAMLKHATLLVTAWDGDLLVGVSRCLCDFAFANYCSDLAVRQSHQKLGIGRELLRLSLDEGGCKLILLSAPKAVTYYPHIGLTQHPSAWTLDPGGLH